MRTGSVSALLGGGPCNRPKPGADRPCQQQTLSGVLDVSCYYNPVTNMLPGRLCSRKIAFELGLGQA